MKYLSTLILSLTFVIELSAQYSKTYDMGGSEYLNNMFIDDTSYTFIGSSIANWSDYLSGHKSILCLKTDLVGNVVNVKLNRSDSLSFHFSLSVDRSVIEESEGLSFGLMVFDTSTLGFLRVAHVFINDTLGLQKINFLNSINTEFMSSIFKINDYYMFAQVLENTTDLFVAKFDSLGNEIFRKYYGGVNWEAPGTMIKLNENEFLISGSTDSGAVVRQYSSVYASNGFIAKIDSNGVLLWEKKFETPGHDRPINLFKGGYYSQIVEAPVVGFSEDYYKIYWGQINENTGEVLFVDTIASGSGYDINIGNIEKIQKLQNGDILVLSIGINDAVYKNYADIRRYNSAKELLWHKTYKNTDSGWAWLYTFQEDTLHNNELVFAGFNNSQIDTFSQDVWVLKLNADGCINSSSCGLAIGMIDISPPKEVFEIEAYPNPAQYLINVAVGNSSAHIGENLQIEVFNSAGKKVFQTKEKLQGQFPVFQVDVSAYTKGIYYIKASVNGQDYGNGKFVKE